MANSVSFTSAPGLSALLNAVQEDENSRKRKYSEEEESSPEQPPLGSAKKSKLPHPDEKVEFDRTFKTLFGIETTASFVNRVITDPDDTENLEAVWEIYQSAIEDSPSPSEEQTVAARQFEKCIDEVNYAEEWAAKCEIKWLDDEVGYAVFARKNFNSGDVIGFYAGKLTHRSNNPNYTVEFCDPLYENYCIDAQTMGNPTRFFNHAEEEDANVKLIEYYYKGIPYIMLVAKKEIEAEDQFLFDYGEEYWKGMNIQPINLIP